MFQLGVGILRSYALCEIKDSYEFLRECIEVFVYDVMSERSVVEAGHRDNL